MAKVAVPDRYMVETTPDDETICAKPAGLQDEINAAVGTVSKGRAFVRPSGTEDVIRVYAEAATESEVQELLERVSDLLKVYVNSS